MRGSTIGQELKDAYWAILRECLVRFHGFPERRAARRVLAYRRDLEQAPPDLPMDIVFNAEPFDVANDLAGRELDWDAHRDAYLAIMDRSYAAMPGREPGDRRPPGVLPAA